MTDQQLEKKRERDRKRYHRLREEKKIKVVKRNDRSGEKEIKEDLEEETGYI